MKTKNSAIDVFVGFVNWIKFSHFFGEFHRLDLSWISENTSYLGLTIYTHIHSTHVQMMQINSPKQDTNSFFFLLNPSINLFWFFTLVMQFVGIGGFYQILLSFLSPDKLANWLWFKAMLNCLRHRNVMIVVKGIW